MKEIKSKDKLMLGIIALVMALMFAIVKWDYMEQATNLQQASMGIPICLTIFVSAYWISHNI